MEGLTLLVSESLFSNNGTRRSSVATQSADYTTSPGSKNDFGKRCHENTGLSAIVACIGLTESLIGKYVLSLSRCCTTIPGGRQNLSVGVFHKSLI
jgi:hypothetical protein